MRTVGLFLYALFFACATSFAQPPTPPATAANLDGAWDLRVMNKHHKVIATMTVSFTDQAAASCMAGNWKQVKVSKYTTTDADFFPGKEPLAYSLDGGYLTIGRVNACDAYLMLGGNLTGNRVHGAYAAVSMMGREVMGSFVAKRH